MTRSVKLRKRGGSRRSGAGNRPHIRRKNLLLDQAKIDRAKRILKASTETEAVHRALDAVADLEAFQRELDKAFDALIGSGGFVDHFAR
jgi:hypothetical protein